MALDTYLCLGGVALNSQQAAHYGRTGWAPPGWCVEDCCECEGLPQALGYPDGWTTPANDGAPWYDPTEPLSYDFGGLIIQSIEGLGPGPMQRQVSDLAGSGSVIGRRQQSAPTITVTGILMGRTACAIGYGLRWLRAALRGSCGPGCGTDTLRYLECCPPPLDEDCPEPHDWAEHFRPYWRELRRVALISDVEVIEQAGRACKCGCGSTPLTRVQFILAAEQPCVFREPVQVHEGVRIWENSELVENCFEWVKLPDGAECPPDDETCRSDPPCNLDTGCPAPPPPPRMPTPIDACITCTPFTQRKMCLQIEPDVVPGWAQGVIGLQIFSGSAGLRHLRARFFANPLGLPVEELDPCTACGELNVAWIPPFSTFELDGAARTATVTCPGSATTSAASVLGGPPGKLFNYPSIECGGVAYSVCIDVDAATVTRSATIGVSMTVREC